MQQSLEGHPPDPEAPAASRCRGHWPGIRFRFVREGAAGTRCLRHAIVYRPLFRTAVLTAAVVGTILTSINQGTLLFAGHFPGELYWKIPLTYCVPYSVSTFSALRISFVRKGREADLRV